MRTTLIALTLTVAIGNVGAHAQQPTAGAATTPPPDALKQVFDKMARASAFPDTSGTGRYPAMKEETAALLNHVIYRPANLERVGPNALGIVAWGNGACAADGASSRLYLAQIASHGYLVIANGRILSGPGAPPPPPATEKQLGKQGMLPPPQTSAAQLTQAIDWAIKENGRPGSPYFGKLNTQAIAVSGWSCGGLQALQVATSDPRVKTAIIDNSGIFAGESPIPGMTMSKTALDQLHGPILYLLGGPTDVAYVNGMDDFKYISKVPVFAANLNDAGHGGSFFEKDGGKAALATVDWLNWLLKNDHKAARTFVGSDCRLCKDPAWTVASKGL